MTTKLCIDAIQDWDAQFSLSNIRTNPGFMVVKEDWTNALHYDGPGMNNFLWDGPSYYHDRIHSFLVAYGFDFRIKPQHPSDKQPHGHPNGHPNTQPHGHPNTQPHGHPNTQPGYQIVAAGTLYQASEDIKGNFHPHTDQVIAQVDLLVKFQSPDTQAAVVHYIREKECQVYDKYPDHLRKETKIKGNRNK